MYVAVLAIGILIALTVIARFLFQSPRQTETDPLSKGDGEEEIERLILSGHKIQAIKLHRRIHGSSLETAKNAVEEARARLQRQGRLPR